MADCLLSGQCLGEHISDIPFSFDHAEVNRSDDLAVYEITVLCGMKCGVGLAYVGVCRTPYAFAVAVCWNLVCLWIWYVDVQ